jgi:hypothetical protein
VPFDENRVRDVSLWAIDELARYAPTSGHFSLRDFPRDACDITSLALGALLIERDLGEWHVVTREQITDGRVLGSGLHTWLELRAGDGSVRFVIDGTLHQFPQLGARPYVGSNQSPAFAVFTRVRHDFVADQMPDFWERPEYSEAIAYLSERAKADLPR